MNIIYPPLVEQCYKAFKEENKDLQKADVYTMLIENNILTENGMPTEHAIKTGWVKEFTEELDLTFEEFLKVYPIFAEFDKESFAFIDGFWEITKELREDIVEGLQHNKFEHDERIQLESFLSARKEYED
ncbi:hypothetical protein ACFP65_09135 [Marinilactibacillus sp. GCM10026970]|uniref:hypothetical protein n=1 Tax=Marinilactibacillus sp. GCM10026970 TaxID=3252642 RepID=UPI003611560A